MAKKPIQQDQLIDDQALDAVAGTAYTVAELQGQMTKDHNLVNQLVGQYQMASTFSKLGTVASLLKLQHIKNNKLYQFYQPKTGDMSPNWDQFCTLIGSSRRTVDEQIQNLQAFGEDAIESLNAVGMNVRQLRQLRQLDGDVKDQAKQLAKEGDKESLLDLIEEQTAKHIKEKEALEQQLGEVSSDAEATNKLLEAKDKKINQLDKKIKQRKHAATAWQDTTEALTTELQVKAGEVLQAMSQLRELRDQISELDVEDEHYVAAMEMVANTHVAHVNSIGVQAELLLRECDSLFGEYSARIAPDLSPLIGDADDFETEA